MCPVHYWCIWWCSGEEDKTIDGIHVFKQGSLQLIPEGQPLLEERGGQWEPHIMCETPLASVLQNEVARVIGNAYGQHAI